ncbi:MAG TPA: energy transducer TonB [Longimicrobium sp.]|nr:energy transducer TonB [Longimicrobium sp.]
MKHILFAAALCCAAMPAGAQDGPAGGVYELAQVETMPRPTNVADMRAALEAGYPAELRGAGRQGTVVVSLVVSPEGDTREVGVVSSSEPGFDSATVAAVRLLRFTPAAVAGKPVAVRLELPIQWQAPRPAEAVAAEGNVTPAGRTQEGEAVYAMSPVVANAQVYELRAVEVQPRPTNLAVLRRELERLYPPVLRDAGREGLVQVRFAITAEGAVREGSVTITSSSEPGLNVATMQAIQVLRFRPALVGGRAVPVWVELPIQWSVGKPASQTEPVGSRIPAMP